MEEVKVLQVAIFQSSAREKMETFLNNTLIELAKNKYEYQDMKIWNSERNGGIIWHASIEFLVKYSEAVGESEEDDAQKEISALRRHNYDSEQSMTTVGLIGLKAFVYQNGLEEEMQDVMHDYSKLQKQIVAKTNLDFATQLNKYTAEIEVVNVNIDVNLENNE
jgi:hypothetical protein